MTADRQTYRSHTGLYGKDAAMDVTVVMTEAATTPGFAQDYAFGNKRRTAGPKELPLANRC